MLLTGRPSRAALRRESGKSALRKVVGVAGIVFRKEPQTAQAFRDCLPTATRAKKRATAA